MISLMWCHLPPHDTLLIMCCTQFFPRLFKNMLLLMCNSATAQKTTTLFLSQLYFKWHSKLITLLYHPHMISIFQEKTKLQNLT